VAGRTPEQIAEALGTILYALPPDAREACEAWLRRHMACDEAAAPAPPARQGAAAPLRQRGPRPRRKQTFDAAAERILRLALHPAGGAFLSTPEIATRTKYEESYLHRVLPWMVRRGLARKGPDGRGFADLPGPHNPT
jgi:hypothetical protein